jgi:DNA-binding HxlR family transcriptional regulator
MESVAETAANPPVSLTEILENCVGCKWTVHVLGQVRAGVVRPGALERSAPGLTAKVLAERLAKLVRFGLLERTAFPEVPPRVEYRLTAFGERFVGVLDELEAVRREFGR